MKRIPTDCQRLLDLAERDPRRAVALARRAVATADAVTCPWATYALGWALFCWERFDEARDRLRSNDRRFADDPETQLCCRALLLLIDFNQNLSAPMADTLAETARALDAADERYLAQLVRLYLASLLNILGRTADAADLLDTLGATGESLDPRIAGRILRVQGATARGQGAYRRADELLARADAVFAGAGLLVDRAKGWYERAAVALMQERFEEALGLYLRAERVFTHRDLPLRLALSARDASAVYTRLGRYDRGLELALRALLAFSAIGRERDVARCHLQLGNIYFFTGCWEAALGSYRRAEAGLAALGILGGDGLIAQLNQALALQAMGQAPEALALLASVEGQARKLDDAGVLAEVMACQALLLADGGDTATALARFEEADQLFGELDNLAAAANSQVEQAWLRLREGDLPGAYALFSQAEPALRAQPFYHWRAEYGLARCAEAWGDERGATQRYQSACKTVAALRTRLWSETLSSRLYEHAVALSTDALRLAARTGDAEGFITLSETQRALVLRHALSASQSQLPAGVQREHDELRNRLRHLLLGEEEASPALDPTLDSYGELLLTAWRASSLAPGDAHLRAAEFDLEGLRAGLSQLYGASWTALSYLVVGQLLVVTIVTADTCQGHTIALDRTLQRLIDRATRPEYRAYTYEDLPFAQGQAAQPWQGLTALAERLLPPELRARLHPGHRLCIVPAGPLHELPWALLRLPTGWLVEQAVLHVAPSLSTLQLLASTEPAPHAGSLLVGCGTFDERGPPLPHVAEELEAVASALGGDCERWSDAEATCEQLSEQGAQGELGRYSVLHIASHAQLLPARGSEAHIKLWDGDLGLPAITQLGLRCGLVTLSTCDGAGAEALRGEEVLSLSWAFLAAGARGVIGSLWPTYDRFTVRLMGELYVRLRRHGDAALALAEVQRAMAATSRSGGGHDDGGLLTWGGFVAIGLGRLA